MSTELTCRLRSANPVITNALSAQDNFNKVQHLSLIRQRAVPKGNELMKGGSADNTERNEIRVAHDITQNSHPSKSMCPSEKSCR